MAGKTGSASGGPSPGREHAHNLTGNAGAAASWLGGDITAAIVTAAPAAGPDGF
jgi:hypothetical protein